MHDADYFRWLTCRTKTAWWHDSAHPPELARGLARGAVGVTTNPALTNLALGANRDAWAAEIREVLSQKPEPERQAELLMCIPVTHAAEALRPVYERTGGRQGYVCAQVNPARAGDREVMLPMAGRLHAWAPNIAVKLPATAAGLDVLEECVAEGITVAATVSFTVPQAIAVAERHRRGAGRARAAGVAPGRCFAVLMIGRLDDYLREVARDARADAGEADVRQAGLAVAKRAYSIYRAERYDAVLLVAAMRGTHHVAELAGADLILSIAPPFQEQVLAGGLPQEERIGAEVAPDVIARLSRMPEFVRAYEPDGLAPEEFVSYGVTQRTLAQFSDAGWRLMESFR